MLPTLKHFYFFTFIFTLIFNYRQFCRCCKKCSKNKYDKNTEINNNIEEDQRINDKNKNNEDNKNKNDDKENKPNIVKDDSGKEINLNDYILIKEPEYFIDFSNVKEEDKKIKFIFLTKPIDWGNWWCWMISEIQSLFSVPMFFEYIANGNFNDPKFYKLKKLQELLLEMIENQKDPTTNKFSIDKFKPYYKYFIDDKIFTTGHMYKNVKNKIYGKLIKYGDGGGLFSFLNYLNILKCLYFHLKNSYENTNIISPYILSLVDGSFDEKYWECKNIEECKNKIEDYCKNKNIKIKLLLKFLGNDYLKCLLNRVTDKNYNKKNNLEKDLNIDFIFILDQNIKEEFNKLLTNLNNQKKNLNNYCNIITDIFNKFNFELNSINVHPLTNHMFNINYNNNDKCFYSYDTLGGKNFKKLTNDEVIDFIENNKLKDRGANSIFYISVVKH